MTKQASDFAETQTNSTPVECALATLEELKGVRNAVHEFLAQAHAETTPPEPQHLIVPPMTSMVDTATNELEQSGGHNPYLYLVRVHMREIRAAIMVRRVARELCEMATWVGDLGVLAPVEMDIIGRNIQLLSSYVGSARNSAGEIGVACASDVGVAKTHLGQLKDQSVQCELFDDDIDPRRRARDFIAEMVRRLTVLEKASYVGTSET